MKNNIFFLLTTLSFLFASCDKLNDSKPADETPASIEGFEINGSVQYAFNAPISLYIDEAFNIHYTLMDNDELNYHEFFFLINDDPSLKVYVFRPELNMETEEKGYAYSLPNLNSFTLDNLEVYDSKPGDKLYFYMTVIDTSGNITEKSFVIELDE